LQKSRRQLFEELDQPVLRPLPQEPYEYAIWKNTRVNIDYHVEFEKHFYSVPYELIHQEIRIRATEHMLEIFHQGKVVAAHPAARLRAATPPRLRTCRKNIRRPGNGHPSA